MAIKNKIKKTGKIILDLADALEDFRRKTTSLSSFWYWDYYDIIKREVDDANERKRIYQQIYHLEKLNYFTRGGFSPKGLIKLLKAKFGKDIKNEKWDGKWRIVIFDISEKRRNARDCFRASLKSIGYKKLQNSTWINHFGNFDDIQVIAKDLKIESDVVLIAAENISNDILFKKKFDLIY